MNSWKFWRTKLHVSAIIFFDFDMSWYLYSVCVHLRCSGLWVAQTINAPLADKRHWWLNSLQLCVRCDYASALRRRRHYVFGLSVRPSVRPKPEISSFDLYMGPLVHPTNRNRFTACPSVRPSVCPSVRPERFPGICRKTHRGNGLKFYMLMYLDHLHNWLVYSHSLLIFLILALFWLSETGQIWGFRAFPGERIEEMASNFACWCILTTFKTDKFMAKVCWFF